MTRRAHRTDGNQREIVEALRKIGATVRHTHMVGDGFPDLAVGYRGKTLLLEVKDGSKPPSRQELTKEESAFFAGWEGHAAIVNSPEAAIRVVSEV